MLELEQRDRWAEQAGWSVRYDELEQAWAISEEQTATKLFCT